MGREVAVGIHTDYHDDNHMAVLSMSHVNTYNHTIQLCVCVCVCVFECVSVMRGAGQLPLALHV